MQSATQGDSTASSVQVSAPPCPAPPADSPFSWPHAPPPCDVSRASGPLVLSNYAIPGVLCAGGYPGALSVEKARSIAREMAAARFDTYVNLMRTGELARFRPYAGLVEAEADALHPPLEHQLDFLQFPIGDGSVPSAAMEEPFLALVAALVMRLRGGRRLYLHCWGGHGRTGMVLTVMLAAIYPGLSGEAALDLCQQLHSSRLYNPGHKSPEPGQRAFVLRMVARMRLAQRLGPAWHPPQGFQIARLPYAPYVDPAAAASADRMDTDCADADESALGHDEAARSAPAGSGKRSSARARAQAILSGQLQAPSTPPRAGGGNGVIVVDPFGTASTTAALAAVPSTPLMSPAVRRLSAGKAEELSLAQGHTHSPELHPQALQQQPQQFSLLPRQMVPVEDVCDAPDGDGQGQNASPPPVPPAFTLLTMNTLADGLATPESFPHTDPAALVWERRRHMLLDELTASRGPATGAATGAGGADILCLQEVDHFDDWFSPQLAARGYGRGWFLPKRDGGPAGTGDGVALFVRPEAFRVLRVQRVHMFGMNQVALFLQLAPVCGSGGGPARRLYVATTHLKAKEGYELVRLKQAQVILHHLQQFIARFHGPSLELDDGAGADGGAEDVSSADAEHNPPHASQRFSLPPSAAVIFAGDFNDTPQSCTYGFIATGSASEDTSAVGQRGAGASATAAAIPSALDGVGRTGAAESPTAQAAAMVDAIVDGAFADPSSPAPTAAAAAAPLSVLAAVASARNNSDPPSRPFPSLSVFSPTIPSSHGSDPAPASAPAPIPPPPVTHSLWLHSLYNRLYSALEACNHPGALYTTAKRRGVLVQRCIDYIWFSPLALRPVALLSVPDLHRELPNLMPDLRYPSDHLAIAGRFEWKTIGH